MSKITVINTLLIDNFDFMFISANVKIIKQTIKQIDTYCFLFDPIKEINNNYNIIEYNRRTFIVQQNIEAL